MIERITHVTIYVRDQDEAFEFYTKKLGLEKVEDSKMPSGDRWLTVAPKGCHDVQIVLQKPTAATFGDQAPELLGRVGQAPAWAFKTDDCQRECDELQKKGVRIVSPPTDFGFAIEATFLDLYGNPFILMQPPAGRK